MFTGLVADLGKVSAVDATADGVTLAVRTPSVTPSSPASTAVTVPRSWTSPVNTLTTPAAGRR